MMDNWKKTKRYKQLMFSVWMIKNKRLIASFKEAMKKAQD